jgi:hypothetical protein
MWRQISTCTHSAIDFEAISHVGLSTDGHLALVFSPTDEGIVWDVFESRIRRFLPDDPAVLDRFIAREGFLNVDYGFGNGKYRIIGIRHNFPLVEHRDLELGIAVDPPLNTVTLYSIRTGQPVIVLTCESLTDDWAIASFADDGRIAAVVDESAATFCTADER